MENQTNAAANEPMQWPKPDKELPIQKPLYDLLRMVDGCQKNLTADNRHTYWRWWIQMILEMQGYIRAAKVETDLRERAKVLHKLCVTYNDLAMLIKLKTDTGDLSIPAYVEMLKPLGLISRQAFGWYEKTIRECEKFDK